MYFTKGYCNVPKPVFELTKHLIQRREGGGGGGKKPSKNDIAITEKERKLIF